MKILTAAQMAEVDRLTSERYGIPSILLMENAGRSFVDELTRSCPGLRDKRILILCGRGNNGGDGFVAARYLALAGASPSICLFADPGILKGDARTNWQIAHAMGIPMQVLPSPQEAEAYLRKISLPDVIVDALFGTGLSKPIGQDFSSVIQWIAQASSHAFVAAVDIPSGLMADCCEIPGPAVRADLTVTFSALKLAHIMPPAADYAGKVVLVPIGSPAALFDSPDFRWNLIDTAQVRRSLPQRARDGHKGSYGHIYIVAGSAGKSGAALMTGMAALRAGAGLATVWLPEGLRQGVVGNYPELMTEFLPETAAGTSDKAGAAIILRQLPLADALVIGPGMTTHPSTCALIGELVRRSPVPVILDADGINAFASSAAPLHNECGQSVVITPHPGEMARLLGCTVPEVQRNRMETACACAARHQCSVILKGFQTVLATPEGDLFINPTGNPGMATGGTGDILAGMTGRFVAGWKLRNSTDSRLADYLAAAVYLHALSGDLAAEEGSMESLIATDLLTQMPRAFKKVMQP